MATIQVNSSLNVAAGQKLTFVDEDAFFITQPAPNTVLSNGGNISVAYDASSPTFDAAIRIHAPDAGPITVWNKATGSLTVTGDNIYGLRVTNAPSVTVNNDGVITVTATNDAFGVQHAGSGALILNNTNTLTVSGSYAVAFDGTGGSNTGTISVKGAQLGAAVALGGNGPSPVAGSFTNAGTITATVTNPNARSTGVSMAGGTVQNSGVIQADMAIVSSQAATVINKGSIVGDVVLNGGAGSLFDSSAGKFSGQLFGGGGNDTFILGAEDHVIHLGGGKDVVDGGGGADVAVFDFDSSKAGWTQDANGVWTVTFDPAASIQPVSAQLTNVEILRFKDKDVVLATATPTPTPTPPVTPQSHDYNGDGRGDLLFQNSQSGQTVIWYSAPGGGYDPVALIAVTPDWSVVGAADFTGDGRSDILWRNTQGEVVTWDSTGNFITGRYLGAVPTSFKIEQIGDFTGDGKADILWRNDGGQITLWTSGSGPGFGTVVLGKMDAQMTSQPAGDFNGDGRADVLWRDPNGYVTFWYGAGNGFNSVAGPMWDRAFQFRAVGDMDGEGRDDILLILPNVSANGFADILYGQASGGFISSSLGFIPAGLTFEQIADMNGDGRDDIVWRAANGDVVVWSSGQAAGQFTTGLIAAIPNEWLIL